MPKITDIGPDSRVRVIYDCMRGLVFRHGVVNADDKYF